MPAVSKYFDLVMNKISHLDRIHWVGIAVEVVYVGQLVKYAVSLVRWAMESSP